MAVTTSEWVDATKCATSNSGDSATAGEWESSTASFDAVAGCPHCPLQTFAERMAMAGLLLRQQHFDFVRQHNAPVLQGSGVPAASGISRSSEYRTSSAPATTRCPQRLRWAKPSIPCPTI